MTKNNTVKLIELWKGQDGVIINDNVFLINHHVEHELKFNGYEETTKNIYIVELAYDFNVSNIVTITASGLKSLENKLNKIDYKIVKPENLF